MKKLIYTSEYREKIIHLRNDLDLKYGKEVRQKVFSEIDHRIQQLKAHHYLGISVREKYGVNCDYHEALQYYEVYKDVDGIGGWTRSARNDRSITYFSSGGINPLANPPSWKESSITPSMRLDLGRLIRQAVDK